MPADPNARTSPYINLPDDPDAPKGFRSLRWRLLTPLVAVLMSALMCGVYGVASALLTADTGDGRDDLTETSRSIAQNAVEVGRAQRQEVDRIAFTEGVVANVLEPNGAALQPIIEPLAALGNLDLVLVADANSNEIIGLQRVVVSGSVDYAVTDASDLTAIPVFEAIYNGADSASVIALVERRPMLLTAGPILVDGEVMGVAAVGADVTRILSEIRGGNAADIALYSGELTALGSTFDGATALDINEGVYNSVLAAPDTVTFEAVALDDTDYDAAYFPFVIGQAPLGVLAVYAPQENSFSAQFGRQMLSILAAFVVGAFCIGAYVVLGLPLARLEKIRSTADALTAGEAARVNLRPKDEIGRAGVALDRYAAAAQAHLSQVQADLRKERREVARLNAILESLPHGVLVQDVEGRVMTMNNQARDLLGAYGDSDAAGELRAFSATAERKIGAAIAPGIHALGEQTIIQAEGRYIRVEAAAVESMGEKRIGTVLLLRDISNEVAQETQRDDLIDQIMNDVHVSMSNRAQAAALEAGTQPHHADSEALAVFAKEVAQDARAMQRIITDYRDLTLLQPDDLRRDHGQVAVVSLISEVMAEWQPIAAASDIALDMNLPPDDELYVLGDDKRLLWALGNILDNSIKYSQAGGQIMLVVNPALEASQITFSVRDTGVGIAEGDLPHVMTRFYRGKPTTPQGEPLTIPGSGQGLYLSQKVIRAHGGDMAISSVQHQGTSVSVILPMTAGVSLEMPPPVRQKSIWDEPTRTEMKVELPRDSKA